MKEMSHSSLKLKIIDEACMTAGSLRTFSIPHSCVTEGSQDSKSRNQSAGGIQN